MFHHFILVRDWYFSSNEHPCTRYSSYTQPKLLSRSGSCFSDKCFLLTTRAAQQMSIYVTISHLVTLVACLLLLLMLQRSLTELHLCRCLLRLWEKWGKMHLCLQTKAKQSSQFTFPASSLPLQSTPFPVDGERDKNLFLLSQHML